MSNKALDNQVFAILLNSARIINASYQRTSEFFLNSNLFVYYLDQMKVRQVDIGIISSINLQCTGHGSFAPHKVAARFLQNLQQIIEYNQQIKRVKIRLSGFDLEKLLEIKGMSKNSKAPTLVYRLTQLLSKRINTLTSLEIRITNVRNCRTEDFKSIMGLGINTDARDLANLSCEFSDWTFAKEGSESSVIANSIFDKVKIKPTKQDRHYQPNIEDFMRMLDSSFDGTVGQAIMQLKKFRLEISTWYYTDYEAQTFFYSFNEEEKLKNLPKQDKIQQRMLYFHNEFRRRVENLVRELMVEVTHMEIDLRNWNKKFQMGILKSSLLNIPSSRVNPLSQISRRLSNDTKKLVTGVVSKIQNSMNLGKTGNNKKEEEKKNQKNQEQKPKELYFIVVV